MMFCQSPLQNCRLLIGGSRVCLFSTIHASRLIGRFFNACCMFSPVPVGARDGTPARGQRNPRAAPFGRTATARPSKRRPNSNALELLATAWTLCHRKQSEFWNYLNSRIGMIDGGSAHRRNREFCTFLGAGRPARRDRLGLGVKADRIRPVLVEITEARTLPAAERVIGQWHRDREIDADHADLDPASEVARGVAVAGEDRDAVAVFAFGRQPQRLLVILGAHHREDGAENLLLVAA